VPNCIDKARSGRCLLGLEGVESSGERIGYLVRPVCGGTNSLASSDEDSSATSCSLFRSVSRSSSSPIAKWTCFFLTFLLLLASKFPVSVAFWALACFHCAARASSSSRSFFSRTTSAPVMILAFDSTRRSVFAAFFPAKASCNFWASILSISALE